MFSTAIIRSGMVHLAEPYPAWSELYPYISSNQGGENGESVTHPPVRELESYHLSRPTPPPQNPSGADAHLVPTSDKDGSDFLSQK
jgi:hypothetical protein